MLQPQQVHDPKGMALPSKQGKLRGQAKLTHHRCCSQSPFWPAWPGLFVVFPSLAHPSFLFPCGCGLSSDCLSQMERSGTTLFHFIHSIQNSKINRAEIRSFLRFISHNPNRLPFPSKSPASIHLHPLSLPLWYTWTLSSLPWSPSQTLNLNNTVTRSPIPCAGYCIGIIAFCALRHPSHSGAHSDHSRAHILTSAPRSRVGAVSGTQLAACTATCIIQVEISVSDNNNSPACTIDGDFCVPCAVSAAARP